MSAAFARQDFDSTDETDTLKPAKRDRKRLKRNGLHDKRVQRGNEERKLFHLLLLGNSRGAGHNARTAVAMVTFDLSEEGHTLRDYSSRPCICASCVDEHLIATR